MSRDDKLEDITHLPNNAERNSNLCETSNGASQVKADQPTTDCHDQSFGSLNDLYLSGSVGTLDTNSESSQTSPSTAVMSDRVQRIASNIYAEFEAMIEAYGLPVVERLMPLVIGLLENLDELYKDQTAYHEEVYQLREQNSFMLGELGREKDRRKQAELRFIDLEDAFDEERKAHEAKVEALTLNARQAELKYQNMKDQFARMESKEADWKKESQRLHEHINELIRSKLDLADQVKFANRATGKSIKPNAPIRLGSSAAPILCVTVGEDEKSQTSRENMYDATSSGFGFDEMPSSDAEGVPLDEELPAGMRKEIDILIKENMELVETKNALNVVKDDLIAKLDALNLENASLRESISHLTKSRSTLQSELASTDQLLNDARHELTELRDRIATPSRRLETTGLDSTHRKRFTRAEMARVVSERNQFKERLMELQDTVRFTETVRAGQKGHPELLVGLGAGGSAASQSAISTIPARPLQTLQNIFAAFIAPNRNDSTFDRPNTPTAESVKLRHGISHSWVRLSRTRTANPIYGWSHGLESPFSKRSPSGTRLGFDTGKSQLQTIPVPVQCRTIGGLHGKQLEVTAVLLVPCSSTSVNTTNHEHQVWLIGRGPGHSGPTASPSSTGNRGFVGQVHVFELSRFSQPLLNFDLDDGFMPTAAVFVDTERVHQKLPLNMEVSDDQSIHKTVQFRWESLRTKTERSTQSSVVGHIILASNDCRFLILEVVADLHSLLMKSADSSNESPTRSLSMFAIAQFHVQNISLVSNCMTSIANLVCLSLSNPSGTSCINVVRLTDSLDALSADTSGVKILSHKLTSIPGDCAATGPVVMDVDHSVPAGQSSVIWLGTAGCGNCHALNLLTQQFVQSFRLPRETPCLHAICVQPPDPEANYSHVWLSVSGNPIDGIGHTTAAQTDESRGMARLIAFRTDNRTVVCQIDLTKSLCTMMDTEGVTDPVDLTICRLLVVSDALNQTVWFATRSGLIGRFPLCIPTGSTNAGEKPHIPSISNLSLSCHGYRRPVCNLISVKSLSCASQEMEQFVIAVGHDYVNLRPKQPKSPTHQADSDASYTLRPMGSGAHTIVWKLNVASG